MGSKRTTRKTRVVHKPKHTKSTKTIYKTKWRTRKAKVKGCNCSAANAQAKKYRAQSNKYLAMYRNIQKELNILKEMPGKGGKDSIKGRAKAVLSSLEQQYGDRLVLLKNQRGALSKQTQDLNFKRKKIIDNKKLLEEQENTINTKNQEIIYAKEDSNRKAKINKKLKLSFFLLGLCVIILTLIKRKIIDFKKLFNKK